MLGGGQVQGGMMLRGGKAACGTTRPAQHRWNPGGSLMRLQMLSPDALAYQEPSCPSPSPSPATFFISKILSEYLPRMVPSLESSLCHWLPSMLTAHFPAPLLKGLPPHWAYDLSNGTRAPTSMLLSLGTGRCGSGCWHLKEWQCSPSLSCPLL